MKTIDGKELARQVREEVKEKLHSEKFKNIIDPHLVVIQVGDDPASNTYIRNKKKACEEVGIKFSLYKYKEDITTEKLMKVVEELSLTVSVTGILVQLPLPNHIDEVKIIEQIDPAKDVDGFTQVQAGMLQLGMKNENRLLPCTAKGIIRILESVTDLKGKKAVVIGRSNIVGKPVAQLLQEKNATVTLCHSNTNIDDIHRYLSNADIVVLAVGKPKYFTKEFFYSISKYKTKIIIDAGINRDENNKLCGDFDSEGLELFLTRNSRLRDSIERNETKIIYTPVPGGVGPMTVAELIDNIYLAYENQYDFIWKHCQNLALN